MATGGHLQAREEVDGVPGVFYPHVQSLPLLHDDAWRQERAVRVPEAIFLALGDAVQLRQEATERLRGVKVQLLLSRESPCTTKP